MISKKVLAKVNEVIAVAVTKHRILVELHNYTVAGNTLRIAHVQKDCTSLYRDGGDSSPNNDIHLSEKYAFSKLNDTLRWLHTLEGRTCD